MIQRKSRCYFQQIIGTMWKQYALVVVIGSFLDFHGSFHGINCLEIHSFQFLSRVNGILNELREMESLLGEIKIKHSQILIEPGVHPSMIFCIKCFFFHWNDSCFFVNRPLFRVYPGLECSH